MMFFKKTQHQGALRAAMRYALGQKSFSATITGLSFWYGEGSTKEE